MSSLADLSRRSYHQLPIEQFLKKLKECEQALLIDIRRDNESAEGALEGAISMDVLDEKFFIEIAKHPITTKLFIYCSNGKRSAIAGKHLSRMGYETTGLQGGYLSLKGGERNIIKQRN